MEEGKPTRSGLLALLAPGETLKTPQFQRAYAWGPQQVEDYWNDLIRALDAPGGPNNYFMGLIVLDTGNHIEDGQQRLATTLLLASEMYEAMEAAKKVGTPDEELAKDLASVVAPALRTKQATLAIDPKDQDVLLGRAGIRIDSESKKRIEATRKKLRKLLSDDLASHQPPNPRLERLSAWADFLESSAYVVALKVPPQNAHNIFETLNTRGLRLSNGDLVKSHLIAGAPAADVDAAVSKWNDITKALADPDGAFEEDLERFLLHFYGSRYERTTNQQLFTVFREQIAGRKSTAVMNELLGSARIYRALIDPPGQTAFWNRIGGDAQRAVELVNGLGLRQLRYLLLAVLRDLASDLSAPKRRKRQAQAIVKIAEWSVRGLVHNRTGGGDAERTYIGAAERIRDGRIKTVKKLQEWFEERDMLPTDDALFESAFKDYPFDKKTSHTAARQILLWLENSKISSQAGLTTKGTLTVEHVLPQNPKDTEWTQFSDEEKEVYAYRLGNLLLIDGPSRANTKLGNKEWPDKKKVIQGWIQSWGPQTPLTTAALNESDWNKQTIDKRQGQLAKLAKTAFSL